MVFAAPAAVSDNPRNNPAVGYYNLGVVKMQVSAVSKSGIDFVATVRTTAATVDVNFALTKAEEKRMVAAQTAAAAAKDNPLEGT